MRLGRTAIAAIVLLFSGPAPAEDPKTYHLTIGNASVEIDPGETVDFTLPDGRRTTVTLTLNAFATYAADMFSFVHPTAIAVTRTAHQHLMTSASGTLVIVQEYDDLNPRALNGQMLRELTDESIRAGGRMSQGPASRTLADGKVLNGLRATVEVGDDTTHFEVLSFGVGRGGVLAVTRIDDENMQAERAVLDRFWATLKIRAPGQ